MDVGRGQIQEERVVLMALDPFDRLLRESGPYFVVVVELVRFYSPFETGNRSHPVEE